MNGADAFCISTGISPAVESRGRGIESRVAEVQGWEVGFGSAGLRASGMGGAAARRVMRDFFARRIKVTDYV